MMGRPTLPTAAARSPAANRIDSSICVVVVLPFVPVTPSHGTTRSGCIRRQASSTSPQMGTPAVAVVGSTMVGRRESQALGLSAVYAVAETSAQVRASMADPVESLAARTAAVARTWSPYR